MADLPIRYINLDRDAGRRSRIESQLSGLGLPGERWPAVFWADLPAEAQAGFYSASLNRRQFHRPLVNGEKGCYASHVQLWRWLLQSPHAAMLVLEDDVRLLPGFTSVIEALATMPPAWDMVKLIGRGALGQAEKAQRVSNLTDSHMLVNYQRIPSLTAAYALSRRGAERLLSSRPPFGRPIDVDLRHWWEFPLQVQGVMPDAVALDDTSLVSSVGGKPRATLRERWHKFRHKASYTLLNHWHGQTRRDA